MLIYRAAADLASPETDVLDLGTKDGRFLTDIPGNIVGLDIQISPSTEEPEFIRGDGCQMPFSGDSFDIIISNQVFEHISPGQRTQMLAEINRVLRPGGEFLISIPNRYFPIGGTPHVLPPFWTFLPKSVGLPLAEKLVNREDYEYYQNSLFPIAPWTLRSILQQEFDRVEYATIALGERYGSDVWPQWFNKLFPYMSSSPAFFEYTFSYTAYRCY